MNKIKIDNYYEPESKTLRLDETDLNQTDIKAIQFLLKENQELKEKLEDYENPIKYFKYANKNVTDENQELKKQLDYIRSGEYYNQLRYERDMLQNVVDNGEVSKEDKQFIDMTHRNTELLEQQKEFIKFLEENYKETQDIWYIKILQKYKSIIGGSDEKK